MHHHLQVIEHDPLAGGKTVDGYGAQSMVFFEAPFELTGDRFEMRLGCGGANYKEVSKGRNSAKIQDDDLLRLFVRGEFSATCG